MASNAGSDEIILLFGAREYKKRASAKKWRWLNHKTSSIKPSIADNRYQICLPDV
jgi:hypothetical protein